jgi:hypothetical protein
MPLERLGKLKRNAMSLTELWSLTFRFVELCLNHLHYHEQYNVHRSSNMYVLRIKFNEKTRKEQAHYYQFWWTCLNYDYFSAYTMKKTTLFNADCEMCCSLEIRTAVTMRCRSSRLKRSSSEKPPILQRNISSPGSESSNNQSKKPEGNRTRFLITPAQLTIHNN